MNFDSIGGRRFFLTLGCGIASFILTWFGKISGSEFVTLTTLTLVPYLGFNTQQKIQGVKNDSSN